MGFIYTKTLSVEGLYAKFDTNGDGKISKEEIKAAKDKNFFPDCNIRESMTLDEFEKENAEVYARYERANTEAYDKQTKKAKNWITNMKAALEESRAEMLKRIEQQEKEEQQEAARIDRENELEAMKRTFGLDL